MANITSQNNIRYAIDKFTTDLKGVLISDAFAFDLSSASQITGLNLDYSQPTGTEIYLLFCVNGKWGSLSSAGMSEISASIIDFDTLKSFGNTPASLSGLSNISALAGQAVRVAVGLFSSDPQNAVPKIKISADCKNSSQILNFSKLSSIYNLENSQIISVDSSPALKGSGSVSLFGQATFSDGSISDWQALNNFIGQSVSQLQIRADYSVSDLNSSASIKDIKIVYSSSVSQSVASASGTNYTQLFSNTTNWYMNIKSCRLTVKHSPLENSYIKCYAAFRKAPKEIQSENLGIGTGSKKTYQLAHTNNIQYDSVKLFFDGQPVYSSFEINTLAGRVTLTAPEGVIITASYSYDWEAENWQEMTESYSLSYDDYDQTEFRLFTSGQDFYICAIKIIMDAENGHITSERLGTGASITQTYKLSHRVKDGNISVRVNGSELAAKNYSLHDDGLYISIAADAGKTITANYDWAADFPQVYQFAAVFSE